MDSRKSLADFLEAYYGVRFTERENDLSPSVGLSVVQVLRADPKRAGLIMINNSANIIYVGYWTDVSAAKSIIMPGSGTAISMTWDRDFMILTRPWFAVANVAGPSSLTTIEYIMN